MKLYTWLAHRVVQFLRIENALIALGGIIPVLKKLLPLPEEYEPGSFITIRRDGAIYSVDRSDYMQWHLYAGLEDLSWITAASALASGGIVLDIGANAGQFSLKLASCLSKQNVVFAIHAFEPNPYIHRLLSANLALNPEVGEKVHCHPIALGRQQGMVSFAYNPKNSGGGSVTADSGHHQHKVPMQTLDGIVQSLELSSVTFIKIDVEGYEPEVLIGGEKMIRKFLPWMYVEVTPSWFSSRGYTLQQIIDMLIEWKYELLGECKGEFIPYLKNEQLFRSLHQFNLLAKPPTLG